MSTSKFKYVPIESSLLSFSALYDNKQTKKNNNNLNRKSREEVSDCPQLKLASEH